MPKKKAHHRKAKRKARHLTHSFGHEASGHHARLRKHHSAAAHHSSAAHHPKARQKSTTRSTKAHKSSALFERLRKAEAGAREQIRNFRGRRKQHQHPDKLVTEETLRNHMALKCVRRCSH
jgi:hypothetical protein